MGQAIIGPMKVKGPTVYLSDLVKVKTLGTGTFGRVKLVQHKRTKQVCSLACAKEKMHENIVQTGVSGGRGQMIM